MPKKYTKADFPVVLTVTIENSLKIYFKTILQTINHAAEYEDRCRTLDYALMQRFLRTTYRTLHDIDPEFMEQKLTLLYTNLERMAEIYSSFKSQSKKGLHSYANIFLNQQNGYVEYDNMLQHNSEEVAFLRMQTQRYKEAISEQEEVYESASKLLGEKSKEEDELKRLKRLQNTAVVRLGELVDQNAVLYDVITDFKNEYETDFLVQFSRYTHALEPRILYILNAMAFEFDVEMWHKSKESKIIQNHFKNSYAAEVVSSRTYLEYYLRHLDENKLNAENKALRELLRVMKATTSLRLMIFMPEAEDLIAVKSALESDGAGHEIISYSEAKSALKMVLTCSVDIVILDLNIQENILESFMRTYQENASSCSKTVQFIFVCDTIDDTSIAQANSYHADSLIEREVDAVEILDSVYGVMNPK